jgi:hypothetical protein
MIGGIELRKNTAREIVPQSGVCTITHNPGVSHVPLAEHSPSPMGVQAMLPARYPRFRG